ncbi:YqjF family protein [Psychrobacillus sp. NPDC096426]|uniref:YqjF family protein n=1 Tax=Psychrobacillus sp. NPDC096426 TaxID=3364491 RepID=UPI00380103B1
MGNNKLITLKERINLMGKKTWIITQEWHHVLFLHWPVPPEEVRKYIPAELELDLYEGKAWIGLVFFQVKRNRPRLIPPLPGLRSFLQLNVRTYVTNKGKAGVHFFSLDANHPFIVKLATFGGFLPYRNAEINIKKHKKTFSIHYKCEHQKKIFLTTFQPIGRPIESTQLNTWLTERYCLWTKTKGRLYRVDINHSPWRLQNVTGIVCENTIASFFQKDNYKEECPLVHYSRLKKARLCPPVLEKYNE